jgi:hypothetical protein
MLFVRKKRKGRKKSFKLSWSRSDLTVAVSFRQTHKPANTGILTSCFLAEAQRTQRNMIKTLVSLQETQVTSAFSAPPRD